MDKTPRLLRMVLGSGICAVLVPRRPVSGPRVPGYHTRAGGHRHSPLIPVPDPVPQERWGDYAGSVLGCGKIGREKMYGVSGNNGLAGNWGKIFPPLRELRVRQFCTAAAFIDGPAWIPGFFAFASLVLRPEDDELRVWLSLIVNAGARQLRLRPPTTFAIGCDTHHLVILGRSTSEAKGADPGIHAGTEKSLSGADCNSGKTGPCLTMLRPMGPG